MISVVGNGLCAVPRLYGRERLQKYEPSTNTSQRNATQVYTLEQRKAHPTRSLGQDVLLVSHADGTIWASSPTFWGKKCLLLQRFLNSNGYANGGAAMGEQRAALRVRSRNLPVAGCHFAHGRKGSSSFLLLQRFLNSNGYANGSAAMGEQCAAL